MSDATADTEEGEKKKVDVETRNQWEFHNHCRATQKLNRSVNELEKTLEKRKKQLKTSAFEARKSFLSLLNVETYNSKDVIREYREIVKLVCSKN